MTNGVAPALIEGEIPAESRLLCIIYSDPALHTDTAMMANPSEETKASLLE